MAPPHLVLRPYLSRLARRLLHSLSFSSTPRRDFLLRFPLLTRCIASPVSCCACSVPLLWDIDLLARFHSKHSFSHFPHRGRRRHSAAFRLDRPEARTQNREQAVSDSTPIRRKKKKESRNNEDDQMVRGRSMGGRLNSRTDTDVDISLGGQLVARPVRVLRRRQPTRQSGEVTAQLPGAAVLQPGARQDADRAHAAAGACGG